MAMTASTAPTPYIQRHPFSKSGVAWANGSPSGHGVAGVVSSSPSQIPKTAPSADMMKMIVVNFARARRGATSLM